MSFTVLLIVYITINNSIDSFHLQSQCNCDLVHYSSYYKIPQNFLLDSDIILLADPNIAIFFNCMHTRSYQKLTQFFASKISTTQRQTEPVRSDFGIFSTSSNSHVKLIFNFYTASRYILYPRLPADDLCVALGCIRAYACLCRKK